jgi:hypothetical protein
MRRLPFLLAPAVLVVVFGAVWLERTSAGDEPRPAALDRARVPSDALPAGLDPLADRGFDLATSRRVASHLYLVQRAGGEVCQVVAHDDGGGGGACGPADEFFGGKLVAFGTGQNGEPSQPSSFWIAGVARRRVASVRIHFGAVEHDVVLTNDGGFYYEATPQELATGPATAIDALGRSGKLLASYPIPGG